MNNTLLRSAISEKFQFKIVNGDSSDNNVCLLPAAIDTLGATAAVTQSGSTPFAVSAVAVTMNYINVTPVTNAGLSADSVLDDGTIDTSVVATALDSNRKIRQFRQYLQKNSLVVEKLIIGADNVEVYNEELIIGQINPLTKQDLLRSIRLSEFFDDYQQQTGKIQIDFSAEGGLPIDRNTFMSMIIPDGRTVTFTFIFMPRV